jgi:hypothetical protein
MTAQHLAARLPAPAAEWLAAARDAAGADLSTVDRAFTLAGRRCGRDPLPGGWHVDEAVRVLLLHTLPLRGMALLRVLDRLYRHGDAAERRAVLRALTLLDDRGRLGPAAVALVEDALRTNDTRLIAAALDGYAATHLRPAAYRQAVLKCVFCGIPLAGVAGLEQRADRELARMLADFARERLAAGRPVPADIRPILRRHLPDSELGRA